MPAPPVPPFILGSNPYGTPLPSLSFSPVVGLPTPIPVPNLQRLYFKFAPPVDPRALGTDIRNAQQVCSATGATPHVHGSDALRV